LRLQWVMPSLSSWKLGPGWKIHDRRWTFEGPVCSATVRIIRQSTWPGKYPGAQRSLVPSPLNFVRRCCRNIDCLHHCTRIQYAYKTADLHFQRNLGRHQLHFSQISARLLTAGRKSMHSTEYASINFLAYMPYGHAPTLKYNLSSPHSNTTTLHLEHWK